MKRNTKAREYCMNNSVKYQYNYIPGIVHIYLCGTEYDEDDLYDYVYACVDAIEVSYHRVRLYKDGHFMLGKLRLHLCKFKEVKHAWMLTEL